MPSHPSPERAGLGQGPQSNLSAQALSFQATRDGQRTAPPPYKLWQNQVSPHFNKSKSDLLSCQYRARGCPSTTRGGARSLGCAHSSAPCSSPSEQVAMVASRAGQGHQSLIPFPTMGEDGAIRGWAPETQMVPQSPARERGRQSHPLPAPGEGQGGAARAAGQSSTPWSPLLKPTFQLRDATVIIA